METCLISLANSKINKTGYSVISDALVVPQAVPASITITFNLKIQNDTGDEIYYVGRQVTKTINTGTDMATPSAHSYVSTYQASHKYVYKILVTVDGIDFNVSVFRRVS